jgi:hypothetical protein
VFISIAGKSSRHDYYVDKMKGAEGGRRRRIYGRSGKDVGFSYHMDICLHWLRSENLKTLFLRERIKSLDLSFGDLTKSEEMHVIRDPWFGDFVGRIAHRCTPNSTCCVKDGVN